MTTIQATDVNVRDGVRELSQEHFAASKVHSAFKEALKEAISDFRMPATLLNFLKGCAAMFLFENSHSSKPAINNK